MTGSDRPLALPRALAEAAVQEGRTAWLATLPAALDWAVRGLVADGGCAVPAGRADRLGRPARDRAGAKLVLELAWAHPEARHEAHGLRAWAG